MLAPSADFPPPPSVFFHHQQQHHTDNIAFWPAVPHTSFSAAGPVPLPGRANSFLADMYDDKDASHGAGHKSLDGSGMYLSPPGGIFRADWELGGSVGNSSAESSPSVHNLAPPPPAPAHEQYGYRRATYPYVQRDEAVYHSSPRNDGPVYAEPLSMDHAPQPLAADPAHLHARPMEDSQYVQHQHHQQHQQQQAQHSHHHHPHHNHHSHHQYAHAHSHGHPDDVKMEASAPPMVGGHQHYRPQHSAQTGPPPSAQPMPTATGPTYMTHTGGIPIMHTDDAASKETQYLRRRCFNCHTTEPPSWRRSTLNPGKIVCNKCGLYERTHLRPRPHRFDELRATSKARKAASKGAQPAQQQQQQMQAQQMVHQHMMHQPQQQHQQPPQHVPSPSLSPKSQHGGYVKKEPSDEDYMRRGTCSSPKKIMREKQIALLPKWRIASICAVI